MGQETGQSKFAWTCTILQIAFGAIFFLLIRYDASADASNVANQQHKDHELEHNLQKYPMALDIHMMLYGGFGFLMTFLKRYGFSAVSMTMMLTAMVTEWAIILQGFTRMNDDFTIPLSFMDILEGGLASAAILISFGAVLGKLNPFQLLVMCLIEGAMFVGNSYLGYKVLGALDVGGAIFVHTFGAYFGLAVSMMSRRRKVDKSEHLEGSRYSSDIFAMIGTVLLWVYWPSFNAILANDDAFHRAIMNTYLSLLGSTISAFIVSSFFGEGRRFDIIDIQNATLSGGVAVGAVADLMLQPYGAFLAGALTGTISTIGFRYLQGKLHAKMKLHDTCGVHNLHGIPGVISGLLSILMCVLASKEIYGPR